MKAHPVGFEEASGCKLYKSSSTSEYVTDAQYITEIVVSRKAAKDGATLTYKYWNDKDNKYAKYFRSQITQAHKLLKLYSSQAILAALKKIQWCNSMFPAFFKKEVENQEKILHNKAKVAKHQEIVISEEKKIGPNLKSKKSIFALLREIDNVKSDNSI